MTPRTALTGDATTVWRPNYGDPSLGYRAATRYWSEIAEVGGTGLEPVTPSLSSW